MSTTSCTMTPALLAERAAAIVAAGWCHGCMTEPGAPVVVVAAR